MTKLHDLPKPSPEAITGQRERVAHREAQLQPAIPHATQPTPPPPPEQAKQPTYQPAWTGTPCSQT